MIDHLGVARDMGYQVTKEDIQFNYEGYVDAILQAVEELAPSYSCQ